MIRGGMECVRYWREVPLVVWPDLAGREEAVQCEIKRLMALERPSLRLPSNKEIARLT